MPSKVREPRQPSLEGLNDHITAAGPLQRDGPQTDVAGPVRTEQMRKVATASLGGTERSGHPARPLRRRRTGPGAHPAVG